ncbi:MAG: STAS domain-containing protein [Deltaproteobacteria bacterium]|nr:STAS domain-containing protein [Deltaproteobacteria bacterium]
MEIVNIEKSGTMVVTVSGRLDAVTAPDLEKNLTTILEQNHLKIIVNMAGLTYISSAGLRCILSASKKLSSKRGKLMLTMVQGMVKEVFQMAGLYDLLTVYSSDEEALGVG